MSKNYNFLARKIQKEEKSTMRNLKKILALVLALVMSFSLLATANAFTDSEEINDTFEEAVDVLSNLKVFQGYDDGKTFQPKGDITRAEVAAIIYRIVTGDVEDKQVSLYSDYVKFDDVNSGSWYAGYVGYCANAEYIKGRTATTFDPNGKVTGYEALAMILRAVGYDKNGEFTGTGWQVQVASTAKKLGITNNVTEGTLNNAATREVVAELLFRSILVPQVEYTLAFGYQSYGQDSIGYDTFGLVCVEGIVTGNEYALLSKTNTSGAATASAGRTLLSQATVDGVAPAATSIYAITTDVDVIGQNVYFYALESSVKAGVATYTAVSEATPIGNNVVDLSDQSVTVGTTSSATVTPTQVAGAEYYTNYAYKTSITSGNGVTVNAIDNDGDGVYEYVLSVKKDLTSVTYITSTGYADLLNYTSASTTVNKTDAVKDDLVLAVTYGGRTYIENAEVIETSFKSYTTNVADTSKRYITSTDGVDYKASDLDNRTTYSTMTVASFPGLIGGTAYALVLDEYGNGIAYALVSNPYQFALLLDSVADVYLNSYEGRADLYFADGTEVEDATVDLASSANLYKSLYGSATVADAYMAVLNYLGTNNNTMYYNGQQITARAGANHGTLVAYYVNEDGSYVLVPARVAGNAYSLSTTADGIGYTKGNTTFTITGSANTADNNTLAVVDANTVAFYYDDVTRAHGVLTGRQNIQSITSGTNVEYVKTTYSNLMKTMVVHDTIDNIYTNYLYVVETRTVDTTYSILNVVLDDGTPTTVMVPNTNIASVDVTKGDVYAYVTTNGVTYLAACNTYEGDTSRLDETTMRVYDGQSTTPTYPAFTTTDQAVVITGTNGADSYAAAINDVIPTVSSDYTTTSITVYNTVGGRTDVVVTFVIDRNAKYFDVTLAGSSVAANNKAYHVKAGETIQAENEGTEKVISTITNTVGGAATTFINQAYGTYPTYSSITGKLTVQAAVNYVDYTVTLAGPATPWNYQLVNATMDSATGAEIEIALYNGTTQHTMNSSSPCTATAKILNKSGEVVYSTTVTPTITSNGTAQITLPHTLTAGESYKAVVDITYGTGNVSGTVETAYIEAQTTTTP